VKPESATIEILDNILTEIGAGMVLKLGGFTREEQAWNNACERAKQIIHNYKEGCGLFQMTRDAKAKRESKTGGRR